MALSGEAMHHAMHHAVEFAQALSTMKRAEAQQLPVQLTAQENAAVLWGIRTLSSGAREQSTSQVKAKTR